MGVVHKIAVDFYEDSFTLIAIHSSLEDYALVYALNLYLKTNFKRTGEDIELFDRVSFPIFEWKDIKKERSWALITNQGIKEETQLRADLFEDQPSFAKYYVIPEYKDADYLLRIQHDEELEEDILKSLLKIPKVVTGYGIEVENLKSKTNVIF